jgi:hypothetical protein
LLIGSVVLGHNAQGHQGKEKGDKFMHEKRIWD